MTQEISYLLCRRENKLNAFMSTRNALMACVAKETFVKENFIHGPIRHFLTYWFNSTIKQKIHCPAERQDRIKT
jgi:hypothetical protein